MVVILASLSLSLCIAAVVVIPLLSTIVVGFWPSLSLCAAVFVVASSSQDGHRHGVVVVVSLCCCCHSRPLVCQPLFLLDCWILAIVVISLCCCRHTIVFVVAVVVLGDHHCRSGLARLQLIFLYSYFAFYFMC